MVYLLKSSGWCFWYRWDFGDGISNVIHTKPAPCQTLEERSESTEKQAYVQDAVNFTYSKSGKCSFRAKPIIIRLLNISAEYQVSICFAQVTTKFTSKSLANMTAKMFS